MIESPIHFVNYFVQQSKVHESTRKPKTGKQFKLDDRAEDSRIKREKLSWQVKKFWQNRKGLQMKKLIDAPCERNIKTVFEEHVLSKNAVTYVVCYTLINKQTNFNN